MWGKGEGGKLKREERKEDIRRGCNRKNEVRGRKEEHMGKCGNDEGGKRA